MLMLQMFKMAAQLMRKLSFSSTNVQRLWPTGCMWLVQRRMASGSAEEPSESHGKKTTPSHVIASYILCKRLSPSVAGTSTELESYDLNVYGVQRDSTLLLRFFQHTRHEKGNPASWHGKPDMLAKFLKLLSYHGNDSLEWTLEEGECHTATKEEPADLRTSSSSWQDGFIEAQSSLYICKRKCYGEEGLDITLSICQPLEKAQILYHIKRKFGCGRVRITDVMDDSRSRLNVWPSGITATKDKSADLGSWFKFPKASFSEEYSAGLIDGGGASIIHFKSRAEYEDRSQRDIKLSSEAMNTGLKSEKEVIWSLDVTQNCENLYVYKQFKERVSKILWASRSKIWKRRFKIWKRSNLVSSYNTKD